MDHRAGPSTHTHTHTHNQSITQTVSHHKSSLHMANSYTKFEVSSLSRSRDILGGVKIFNGSHDSTPISRIIFHRRIRYEDMKGGAKNVKNGAVMGHSRSSAMSPFDKAHTTSYPTLIETIHLSCTILGDPSIGHQS